jgi:WD40 repeat protein
MYTPSGHLVFALPGRLMAVPFDLASLKVVGSPVPVVEGVRTEVVRRAAQYSFSETGTLVYAPGAAADLARLVSVGIDGSTEILPFDPAYFGSFALSPDGETLAINTYGRTAELWIYDLKRSRRTRIPDAVYCPLAWMPDGERLIYCRSEGDQVLTVATHLEGAGTETVLLQEKNITLYDVSGDGKYMATVGSESVDVFEFENPDFSDPVLSVKEEGWGPMFSPDDKYLSYTSLENTGSEIYVIALDGSERRWRVSDGGGEEALWSQDGKWLFYSNGHTWYRVPVSTQPKFTYGEPEVAFQGPYLNVPGFGYAVYPSGDRFIVVESVNPSHPITELKVVENWFQELERLAPTKR